MATNANRRPFFNRDTKDMSVLEEEDEESSSFVSSKLSSNHKEYEDESVKIGEHENRAVRHVQIALAVLVVLMAFIITGAVNVYRYIRPLISIEHSFQVHADKIIEDLEATTAQTLLAMESFALQLTIHAIDRNQTWPNVVVSNFETRAKSMIELAGSGGGVFSIVLAPIVSEKQREYYEIFTKRHQYWLHEALAVQKFTHDPNVNASIDQIMKIFRQDEGLRIPGQIFEYEDVSRDMPSVGNNNNASDSSLDFRNVFSHDSATTSTSVGDNDDAIGSNDEELDDSDNNKQQVERRNAPYLPIWQFAPVFPVPSLVNMDLFSVPKRREEIESLLLHEIPVVGKVFDCTKDTEERAADLNLFSSVGFDYTSSSSYTGGPVSDLYVPVFDMLNEKGRNMVGMITSFIYWQTYFENLLPESVKGMIVVLENSCDQQFTYQLDGPNVTYIGEGDLHDPKYDALDVSTGFGAVFLQNKTFGDKYGPAEADRIASEQCLLNIHLYPSEAMERTFLTNIPIIFAMVLVTVFICTTLVALYYQHLINKRQTVVMNAAVKSNAVVKSLFPASVRERLFEDNQSNRGFTEKTEYEQEGSESNGAFIMTSENIFGSKPIADLFTNTTVMFADMVGFTAWSSEREPTQVFILLETVYHAFDMAASNLHVFKVETVGDCYVAATGLPNPRNDHALIMAKFAITIRSRMDTLVRELETILGPDTADLGLRIGLHSGPVTAGVLRGNKGRFQLFGDTMNTASRIESTGVIGKIHVSQETADFLTEAGKPHWVTPRAEKVVAKGKGELQTYWLSKGSDSASNRSMASSTTARDEDSETRDAGQEVPPETINDDNTENKSASSVTDIISEGKKPLQPAFPAKTSRLIEWNVDVLSRLLKKILARRKTGFKRAFQSLESLESRKRDGETLLDEVIDIIELPKFDAEIFKKQTGSEGVSLSPKIVEQLRDLVAKIASMYRENSFHNFDHASHVTMSVTKLLSRIVNPAEINTKDGEDYEIAADLHDHTFGITSDPLTQFACVFSALIHDLDHPGVTNAVLVEEEVPMALKYKNKSVAEQNSVDLAWNLLMQPEYDALRCCIYETEEELRRFRQLVVNVVMATDIMDRDLGALRKSRWEKAFNENVADNAQEDVNRKATIVIEHLIQASDVAHTMQHWHVFKKWNERLFHEMYGAYKDGRYDKDPSEAWYKGEMGFFDFYIIPLAKKLETCGVFGVSSDEYLNYARANRREWEDKGEKIVSQYLEVYQDK